MKDKTAFITGLGYVGLPLAEAFSKHLKTIGFDVDNEMIRLLKRNRDNLEFTTDPPKIKQADFVLICVPTPVTKSKEPDLRYVKLFCKQKPLQNLSKKFHKIASQKERFVIRGSALGSGSCEYVPVWVLKMGTKEQLIREIEWLMISSLSYESGGSLRAEM
jgi:UDP-N-acetyl-D-mannosaminuronate dehydrogenase